MNNCIPSSIEVISYSSNFDSSTDLSSIENRISVFEDAILNWQLNIAKRLIEEHEDSGFAALAIVTAYFEMVGKIKFGSSGSERSFIAGFSDVFPEFSSYCVNEMFRKIIYSALRCALYHNGLTEGNILVNAQATEAVSYNETPKTLTINVLLFVKKIIEHFNSLVSELRSNHTLQENFVRRFNYSMATHISLAADQSQFPQIPDENRHFYSCCHPYKKV